jgi:hypothetical protein
MADNFMVFSEVIPHLIDDEAHWCQSRLDHLESLFDGDLTKDAEDPALRLLPEDSTYDPNCGSFLWAVQKENDTEWGRHLWLYADEGFDPETVATFAQEFLKRFRPLSSFAFTWSETCSKPRVGEFGGGAGFVTADDVQFFHTHEWVRERHTAFQVQQEQRADTPSNTRAR